MKILHVYKTFFPDTVGGVEKVIDQIAQGVAKYDIQSEVFTTTKEPTASTIQINGYTVHRFPKQFEIASTPFSIAFMKHFKSIADRADIIHYHFPYPFADLVHCMHAIDKPTIVTYHSDIVKQKMLLTLYRPLMMKFLSSVDSIVATSPQYVKTSTVLSHFSNKVVTIPIGIEDVKTVDPERLHYWQQKFPKPFFLFIGMMRYYKGLHALVAAAKNLNADVVIMGSGKLSEADKAALLSLCRAVVLPSHLRSEAFGVFLLEGALFSKPMICCEIGTGTTFINIHQETGLVVPPNNPNALHQAMQYMIDNPVAATEMGLHARARYEALFTAEKMAKDYATLYQKYSPVPPASESRYKK